MLPNPSNPTEVGRGANAEQAARGALGPDPRWHMFQRSHRAYMRELPELLKRHHGQWVAYHGDQRLGFSRSKAKLIKECLHRGVPDEEFGVFLVGPYYPDDDIVYFGVS